MRNCFIVFLPVFIAFSACNKPAEKSNDLSPASATLETTSQTCPEHFYYYNREKITLKIHPQMLLIGFTPGQTPENQRKLLGKYSEFENLSTGQQSAAGNFSVVKLKPATTCQQALTMVKKLQQQPEIVFANLTFKPPHTLGSSYPWVGVTSEFIVTVKSAADLPAFKQTVAETATKIVDTLDETTFLLQATKTAKGNALEMANYFHEQPFVENSEPDFFLPGPENIAPGK